MDKLFYKLKENQNLQKQCNKFFGAFQNSVGRFFASDSSALRKNNSRSKAFDLYVPICLGPFTLETY